MIGSKVVINNRGSQFRGLIGVITARTDNGLYRVRFDVPFYGFTSALFFAGEITILKGDK